MIRSNFLRTVVVAALIGFIDIKALVPRSQYEVVWVSDNHYKSFKFPDIRNLADMSHLYGPTPEDE